MHTNYKHHSDTYLKMVTRKYNPRRVALLMSSTQTFQREIIAAIGAYVRESGLDWSMSLERGIPTDSLHPFDGVILDSDEFDPHELLLPPGLALVCVGSGRNCPRPARAPLVCSDNEALVEMAVRHLRDTGVQALAIYSKPKYRRSAWAQERLAAFEAVCGSNSSMVRLECEADPLAERDMLIDWVKSLPQRTGIVAINDSSARDLLQICHALGRKVPDDLTLVGIDNDPLVDALASMPISSVIQGTEEMGHKAVDLLRRKMMLAEDFGGATFAVPPKGLQLARTSRHSRAGAVLRKALAFIDERAGEGIKVEQVAAHVGLSRSALERCFEGNLGVSVHDEILRVRLVKAKEMLLGQHATVAEIAVQCGFRTQQYMHVVFKRELGCTPTEFARRNRLA